MLKNRAPKQILINSDDLVQITTKLLDNYFVEKNLYSLLLLCYLTVKEFSRKNEHLDNNAKVELSLKYIPELIVGLNQLNVIDNNLADEFNKQFKENKTEMRNILVVYSTIFQYKNDDYITPDSKCCFG